MHDDNYNVINELIARGSNVNQCVNNRTALWYAANNYFCNSVKVLLATEADPHIGEPALVQAASYSTVDCVKMLLEGGAEIISVDCQFGSMMLMGAYIGKHEIVEIGLNAGAEINISEMGFYTPNIYNATALMLLFATGEDTSFFRYSTEMPEAILYTRTDFSLQNLCRKSIHNHLIVNRPK